MVYAEIFILVLIIGFWIYKWSTAKYDLWKQRGIPHDKPLPIIGNIGWSVIFGKTSFLRQAIDTYMKFKDKKIYGVYSFRDAEIVICDLELLKKIAIKDFDKFPNHRNTLDSDDSIFSKSLFVLRDRKWKDMRHILTPSFTGTKMRLMYELVNECCVEGVKYVESELAASGKGALELEMKDYFTRYTNDVIASTAFGIGVNSFKDKTNEFFTIGSTLTTFRGWKLFRAILIGIFPKIAKALHIKIMDEKTTDYFKRLVTDAIVHRKEHNIIRPDMIQLLMEAKRTFDQTESKPTDDPAEFNDDYLLAQCFLFFLAGFETVSVCLCFTMHELAMNPDIQERLYEEILEAEAKLDGKPLDYDTLMTMKYMDMVLSESLRKWPPVVLIDRECAADYKLMDDEGILSVEIKKNESILIPIIGLHYDPEYFENPEKFDPERFSDENKHSIKPMTYMPFGVGPRICIGNRLALMETKAIIYHFLLKFKAVPAEKTAKDMLNDIKGFQMIPPNKFWIKFVPKNHNES